MAKHFAADESFFDRENSRTASTSSKKAKSVLESLNGEGRSRSWSNGSGAEKTGRLGPGSSRLMSGNFDARRDQHRRSAIILLTERSCAKTAIKKKKKTPGEPVVRLCNV
jgi:hypothetical protein